ncbi:hypothetical protein DPSP01_000774 [Paraphaeosphaeria sporulosa]
MAHQSNTPGNNEKKFKLELLRTLAAEHKSILEAIEAATEQQFAMAERHSGRNHPGSEQTREGDIEALEKQLEALRNQGQTEQERIREVEDWFFERILERRIRVRTDLETEFGSE